MATTNNTELIVPLTYEDIVHRVGHEIAKMAEFIVPITEFEEQIVQVVTQVRNSGYLLFLYGVPGVGKSTFISSLEWRKHIPIKKIIPINASELDDPDKPDLKLRRLYSRLRAIAKQERETLSPKDNNRSCVIIDYLESLQDEQSNYVQAFFRDLNALLRQAPILIVWPVTQRTDLENMRKAASSFSSTIFHPRIPVIDFTGPPTEDYPKIAKNTILFFNRGRDHYDFQLHDEDFDSAKESFELKPKSQQIIRNYLQEIKSLWEERTEHIAKMMRIIPKPTEVWFIVCYPEAENVIGAFTKRAHDDVDEAWNADYNQLSVYAKDNQREAHWPPQRLVKALKVLNTKILYLPTNTFISCIVAYAKEAGIPITRQKFQELGVPLHWFQKSQAQQTLSSSPVYLQLANMPQKKGKRGSGKTPKALDTSRRVFEYINRYITTENGSDQSFNRALSFALKDAFQKQSEFSFEAEQVHPWLSYLRPDILVNINNSIDVSKNKCICLELHYTTKTAPNLVARYVLEKLNKYMKQIEKLDESGQLPLWGVTSSL